jgi:hypothetical protein
MTFGGSYAVHFLCYLGSCLCTPATVRAGGNSRTTGSSQLGKPREPAVWYQRIWLLVQAKSYLEGPTGTVEDHQLRLECGLLVVSVRLCTRRRDLGEIGSDSRLSSQGDRA